MFLDSYVYDLEFQMIILMFFLVLHFYFISYTFICVSIIIIILLFWSILVDSPNEFLDQLEWKKVDHHA